MFRIYTLVSLLISLSLSAPASINCQQIIESNFRQTLPLPDRPLVEGIWKELLNLERKIGLYEMSSSQGGCVQCSTNIFQHFSEISRFANLITRYRVQGEKTVQRKWFKKKVFLYHFFLQVRSPDPLDPIIIDPTYLQFVKDGKSLSEPSVFVGRRSELVAFFKKYSKDKILHSTNMAGLSAEEFVDLVYGFGEQAGLKVQDTDTITTSLLVF